MRKTGDWDGIVGGKGGRVRAKGRRREGTEEGQEKPPKWKRKGRNLVVVGTQTGAERRY